MRSCLRSLSLGALAAVAFSSAAARADDVKSPDFTAEQRALLETLLKQVSKDLEAAKQPEPAAEAAAPAAAVTLEVVPKKPLVSLQGATLQPASGLRGASMSVNSAEDWRAIFPIKK